MAASLEPDYTIPAIDKRIERIKFWKKGADDSKQTLQQKIQIYRNLRQNRQGQLSATHRHILDLVAYILKTEPVNIEEGIIDKEEYVETLDSFFNANGSSVIIIYYQHVKPPNLESGRWDENLAENERILSASVTDGSNEGFNGKCVIVYRLRPEVKFEMKELVEETYIAFAEVDPVSKNTLAGLSDLITRLNVTAIAANKQWGDLLKTEAGLKIKQNFINDFHYFCDFLSMSNVDLKNALSFPVNWDLYNKHLSSEELILNQENSPDILSEVEKNVNIWLKIVERAIVESQQLRRETEHVGPIEELAYWRRILARFSSILEHMKALHTKSFIQFLQNNKSSLIKKWKELEAQATAVEILSRDNVKYLYALEKFTEPLYRLDPTTIGNYLPPLMHALKMVHMNSRFFNTRRTITAVFVKITNQLILACKDYLTERGTLSIWNEAKSAIICRMKDCIDLYVKYHESYENMQLEATECNNEKPIEISEMFVFGKFDAFKTRLNKLTDVFEKSIAYSILHSSTIEGISAHAKKFTEIYDKISHQNYDPLDHRRVDFDKDYDEFKKAIGEAQIQLRNFFSEAVLKEADVIKALFLLKRFEKLNINQLNIDDKYLELVPAYQKKLEEIRDRYNEDRSDPPLPCKVPPVAGRILWIRQLYKRIQMPMEIFKTRSNVISHEKMQKSIKIYNALVSVFVQYEAMYHKAWFDSAEIVQLALATPLLVRHPETNKYCLNFDPYISEVTREAEHISKFKLNVPEFIKIINFCKERIFFSRDQVKKLVELNDTLRRSIPIMFLNLMKPLFVKLEIAFQPCLSVVTWSSLKVPDVCKDVENVIREVGIFVKVVVDMKEAQIDEVFESIGDIKFIILTKSPSDFYKNNLALKAVVESELEKKSSMAEKTTIRIIDKFLSLIDDPQVEESKYDWLDPERVNKLVDSYDKLAMAAVEPGFGHVERTKKVNLGQLHNDCMDLFAYFNVKFSEVLVKCTKESLEILRRRIWDTSKFLSEGREEPLMETHMILRIPNVVVSPTIDEMQHDFGNIVTNVLQICKNVTLWGQRYNPRVVRHRDSLGLEIEEEKDKTFMRNYYDVIADNKEIFRINISLQGAITLFKDKVIALTKSYESLSYIWMDDKDQQIDEFVQKNPSVMQMRDKFVEYEELLTTINELPEYHIIGPIRVNMDKFKYALTIETKTLKSKLGSALTSTFKEKLNKMTSYVIENKKKLDKVVKDLEDVRVMMTCLAEIREGFIPFDMDLMLIEKAYSLLSKFKIPISKEEQDAVDSLRYNFNIMLKIAERVQMALGEMQEPLKAELLEGVESLKKDVEQFDIDFDNNGPMVEGIPAKEASDRCLIFQSQFDDLWERYETYSSGESLFSMDITEYPVLYRRKKELNLLQKLYSLYLQVMRTIDSYFEIPWSEIDIEGIMAELQEFQSKCRRLPKGMQTWPAYIDLKKKIDDFNETCPLLELMANRAMKDRHWERLTRLCHYHFDVESESFTLANVMEAPLLKYKDDVEDICVSAVKELDIESKLKQVIADWSVVDLQFTNFKQRGELLLKGTETAEIISQLEDSLMVIGSLMANRYNMHYKKDIQLWQTKLTNTSEILERWILVQNLWAYLEAVFIGGDIAKQLPAEAKRFNNIDRSWVKIMYRAHEKLNAVEVCTGDETMGQFLSHLLEQLESCQKSLSGYLETKRVIFPRFCFISDPSLLEILGQAADCHTIQNYLDGFFDNVAKLDFSEKEYEKIMAMYSRENEKIVLEKEVMCTGGVENWLNTLLKTHQNSVGAVISEGLQSLSNSEMDLLTLIDNSVLQVGLLALQVLWTRDAETAILASERDKTSMKKTNQWFLDLLNALIEVTVKDLTKYARVKYEALITIHVHQRDIFDELYRKKIRSIQDFEWLKQARFYYDQDSEEVFIRITDVTFIYQNEFLGCNDRLVITPLTDRCYITLAQAIGMNFGGAPAGPAGTGKTETTKDMGKALGKYVVVFNCSDQMDFRGLGRIFKGLAQAGAWGCFDEFNRIDLPVLSVAAQQIAIILNARKERKMSFLFSDGETYSLDYELGLFITMNPGYAGRQELPENLKVQFRSVAMMVPDRQIIMRVKLAACGFKENVILARKFFTLYKLCEEQLSKQVHYDFGLRNILSCLRTLGAQKRANPNDSEETTLMRVLRDMNLSKLVDEDEPLFLSLIEDMFPGIKLTSQTYKDLQKAIANATLALGIINHQEWNLKTVQLYETSLVRHGLMVLGPTGSGKTRCMWALMRAFTEMGMPHKEIRMNPKAITASQMFGKLDVATNDWTDGIFSTIWRKSILLKKNEFLWIVLDGPVDAVWIENLNSVLDDNKTLTLANGDRIIMSANSKLVFEPDNIDNASPATVSRMGMVFVSASVLKWSPILKGWFLKRPKYEVEVLQKLFNQIYDDAHTFLQTKLDVKMALLEAHYIRQCIDLLEGLLDTSKTLPDYHIEKIFLFAMMWSLGAVLELKGRTVLQEFLLSHPSSLDWPKAKENETIFEYLVSEDGHWIHWNKMVPNFEYPVDSVLDYYTILVPNVDNTRTMYLIDTIAKQEKAVLLIGEQGTAKTVMLKSYMMKYDPAEHLNKSFNFSSASTPNMVQRVFESYVEKRVGTTLGPPNGRKMTVFIDDINMPVINEWGDQVTNEIVRQLMEYGGFYSLDKPGDFLTIQDVMLLAAMIHPGGGRNDIPPRLKRQFNIFNCTLPSDNSMDTIFRTIGEGYFCIERFPENIVKFVPKLVPLTRVLWQRTKIKMLPTPAKFHYVFNLRDLSRIWEGILRIEREECQTEKMLLKLWRHECLRVISDRFVNSVDRAWFTRTMDEVAHSLLARDKEFYDPSETYFVDFLRDPPEATGDEPEDFVFEAPKIYEEIPSYEVVRERVVQNMEQFNEYVHGMHLDLVFFHDALVHLIKISRILGVPRGNALLVGVGGSGKQSLTRLGSFIAGYSFFQIVLTRSYNVGSLIEDLRHLYRAAGLGSKGVSFIFTDNEIKDEGFLEFLNNVLSVGEVANLFPKDELDEIMTNMTPILRKEQPKRAPTQDNLYNYFIERARNNLHVVLCFSPVGEKFRSRSLKFPGLISGCTMNWFSQWPKDALCAVSEHFMSKFKVVCTPETKRELILIMADMQDNVNEVCTDYFNRFRRQTYVTPKSYLSFISDYKEIYHHRHTEINTMAFRMRNGLSKLVDAAGQVDGLRKVLEKNQAVIAVKNVEVQAIVEQVNEKKSDAEVVKAQVQESKDKAEALLQIISKEKAVAEGKLKAAEPALLEAEAALQTIKAVDIATVRKLAKPPYLITLIMDCVLILFGRKLDPVKPDPEKEFLVPSWGDALKVLADTRFLYNLQHFPKDNINGETCDLMKPYLHYPLYNYQAAKQACGNVAGLIQWTISMVSFYSINKDVLPLKANLAVQESKHERANKNLQEAEELLKAKDEELKVVQSEYDAIMRERQVIVDELDACQQKMDTATAMIDGLSGERIRWTKQLETFKTETDRLVGDVLILTGFLSYCGPFNQEFRQNMEKTWYDMIEKKKIPLSPRVNIVEFLTDGATIGEWNLQGLPNDELSIQNGIIVTKASRYPVLIDPQLQGKVWIKEKEKNFQLQATELSHKYFRNHLEDCVSLGRPLLIEDVGEQLDPVLDNLLEKNFIKIGKSLKVKLGDKEVDVNNNFRLYITTKLPNPSYPPEVFARTSIIDFTVTMKGLEDQLLGRVIFAEKRELETERTQLMTDVTANKKSIKELEANLLHKLTTVQGSLIEDVELMAVLNNTKQTAADVTRKLSIARDTEIKINAAREEFRPIATRGSVLYFLVCDMAMVNCMYQTSLVQFLERFDCSMQRSEKSPVNKKRIANIIEYLTYEIFRYKSRGLYETHKYMFILLMTLKIDLQRNAITYQEFQNFIKGGAALDLNAVQPKTSKWITDSVWLNLVALSSLSRFEGIIQKISTSEKAWKIWFDKDAPEEEVIPDGYNNVDTFRKLLLIRAWCMDRMLSQSKKYISDSLGQRYAEPVITLLDVMYTESRPDTPMVCFLSMGSDPTLGIEQLAKNMEIPCRSISMGQGQEVHARKLLNYGKSEGIWILCQNCHLGLEYMDELVITLVEMKNPHPNFRVWITTEPHPSFPISLLQMSIKYTYEPPQGVRAGLFSTYSNMNQEMLDQCDAPQYIPLIYTISFLHTVVQERRKFGPLGWNIPYEFNSSDWLASCIYINNHLNDYDPKRGISWRTIRYMIGEVQYGGRVTDDYDKRLLNTFAKVWFSEAVFSEGFVFYKGYSVINLKQVSDYLKAIDEMPTSDPPQAYGLHSNADITYQSRTAQIVLDTIMSVQPKESDGDSAGESREEVVARQVKEMLYKVPPPYDPHVVRERLRAMGHTVPMNIFLKQEIDQIQIVIKLVHETLKDLLLAIDGIIIMNDNLRDAFDKIYDARIPKIWKDKSWESSTLGFWFTDLLERNNQFHKWLFSGRPVKFWITGFFNPQGFLTAMRQEITRAHQGWALDNVTMHNEVTRLSTEEARTPPNEGVFVYGLYLEGAGWDKRQSILCESTKKVLFVMMPVIHVFALYDSPYKSPKLYQCPVYKKPMRTYNLLVTPLWLQTDKHPDFWTLRGTALLCDNR